MNALLIFDDKGNKLSEELFKDGKILIKKMIDLQNALLVSSDGKRIFKGTIPKKVMGSFPWIV